MERTIGKIEDLEREDSQLSSEQAERRIAEIDLDDAGLGRIEDEELKEALEVGASSSTSWRTSTSTAGSRPSATTSDNSILLYLAAKDVTAERDAKLES